MIIFFCGGGGITSHLDFKYGLSLFTVVVYMYQTADVEQLTVQFMNTL